VETFGAASERFELLGTRAPKMTMTARSIVEGIDVGGHIDCR